jgi:hypothetical protein
MSQRSSDPFDELRHADPAQSRPVPSESKARVWARIQEVNMSTSTPPRRAIGWILGAGGLAVAAAVALVVFLGQGASPTPSPDPGTGIGSCVETYSLETLANRDFAFDGTVAAIDGDQVTFDIDQSFSGSLDDPVTLTATGMTGTSITSAGGPSLAEGQRYLVAGDDTFIWACGFTQPYEAAVAADWEEATR